MIKKLLLVCLLCSTALAQYDQKPMLGEQIDRTNLSATGLEALWLCNEGGGNTVADSSGNGSHGTFVADTTWASGKWGPCLSFDGTGDWVTCGTTPQIQGVAQFSFSVWHKSADYSTDRVVLAHFGSGEDKIFYLRHRSARKYAWILYNAAQAFVENGSSTTYGDYAWHHIVGTYDGAAMHLYVDGVLVDDAARAQSGSLVASSDNLCYIGAGGLLSPTYGQIDMPALWSHALSVSEITDLYANPFQMFERPSIELWTAATLGGAPGVSISVLAHQHAMMAGAL